MDLLSQQLTQQKLAVGTARWTTRTWVKWQYHGGRMWKHNWGALQPAEIMGSWESNCPITCWKIGH